MDQNSHQNDSDDANDESKYENNRKQFEMERKQSLSRIDLSKKGSIDESIETLVLKLNNSTNYYTTSSCSGRIIITTKSNNNNFSDKKKLQWKFVTHSQIIDTDDFIENIFQLSKNIDNDDDEISVLKFESFILHIRCRTLKAVRKLLHCCIDSGQRNSGLMISNTNHLTVAVRNTLNLEIPIIIDGKLMISEEYLRKLIEILNKKMLTNEEMIQRFERNCELKSIFD